MNLFVKKEEYYYMAYTGEKNNTMMFREGIFTPPSLHKITYGVDMGMP